MVITPRIAPFCHGHKYQDGLIVCRNCQVNAYVDENQTGTALAVSVYFLHFAEQIHWILARLEHV